MEIVRNNTYIVIKLLPIKVNHLGGWGNLCAECNKVAESFNLTRKIIQGIRKRTGKL